MVLDVDEEVRERRARRPPAALWFALLLSSRDPPSNIAHRGMYLIKSTSFVTFERFTNKVSQEARSTLGILLKRIWSVSVEDYRVRAAPRLCHAELRA
jgi:hypothetical protein